jgi:hypothetical protein
VQAAARRQFDVVSRAQLIRLGADAGWISRQIASERWQRLFPGTYVVHTGSTTWRTRASAALLYAGPGAALSHRSAGFLLDVVPTPGPDLDISVPHQRRVAAQPGLIVHRRRSMPPTVGRPTCTHPAHTVLDLVDTTGSVDEVVRLLCAAARARIWPAVITEAAEARPRLRNRSLVRGLLGEVADGVESPLEHRYIRDVERRHGLPRARLQARDRVGGVWIRSDALYVGLGVRIELDGALAHPDGRTDSDTWQDNAVLVERSDITLRYRWHHVAVTPCDVAAQVDAALRARGWRSRAHACGPDCPVGPRSH